jgi:hypothetical protein
LFRADATDDPKSNALANELLDHFGIFDDSQRQALRPRLIPIIKDRQFAAQLFVLANRLSEIKEPLNTALLEPLFDTAQTLGARLDTFKATIRSVVNSFYDRRRAQSASAIAAPFLASKKDALVKGPAPESIYLLAPTLDVNSLQPSVETLLQSLRAIPTPLRATSSGRAYYRPVFNHYMRFEYLEALHTYYIQPFWYPGTGLTIFLIDSASGFTRVYRQPLAWSINKNTRLMRMASILNALSPSKAHEALKSPTQAEPSSEKFSLSKAAAASIILGVFLSMLRSKHQATVAALTGNDLFFTANTIGFIAARIMSRRTMIGRLLTLRTPKSTGSGFQPFSLSAA